MKNAILFCILFTLSTLSMFAQETEKVVEIVDISNLTAEEKIIYDSKQHQKHDVAVERYWTPPGPLNDEEGYLYHISLYRIPEDTLNPNFRWAFINDKEFDKLYYSWQGDAVVLGRFENSMTKEHLAVRWNNIQENGSSIMEYLDIPE